MRRKVEKESNSGMSEPRVRQAQNTVTSEPQKGGYLLAHLIKLFKINWVLFHFFVVVLRLILKTLLMNPSFRCFHLLSWDRMFSFP